MYIHCIIYNIIDYVYTKKHNTIYCHYYLYYFSPDKFAVAVDGYFQLCDVDVSNRTNPDGTNIKFCQVRKRKILYLLQILKFSYLAKIIFLISTAGTSLCKAV